MIRNILIIFILLVSLQFCVADSIETESYQGTSLEENNYYENSNIITEEVIDLQTTSAESNENQIGFKSITIEEKKELILTKVSALWQMIGGIFVILFDIAKSLMYFIEVYFIFLVLFKLFPRSLIKIKDGITKWYVEKTTK